MGAEAKIQLFRNMLMLHIKLKEMMHIATLVQIFCQTDTPLTPGVRSKVETFFPLEVVMLHIKLKEMECRVLC